MKKIVALVLSLVMVLGLATTAFAVAPTLYYWNDAAEEWTVAGSSFQPVSGDLDDLKEGADENVLPCYTLGGAYFVEVSEAAAGHKLVYGAQTVYLKEVDKDADLAYVDDAELFTDVTKENDECGKWQVSKTLLKKTFYMTYDDVDGLEDTLYYAKEGTGTFVLVDGKRVEVADPSASFNAHAWVGNDVVNYAYTTAKCLNCGKVATLYANATAAGKGAEKVDGLGWLTKADFYGYGVAAPVAPETDKVESAQTFDAGIAMYVGMSVMAAAGSAVVLKKKD